MTIIPNKIYLGDAYEMIESIPDDTIDLIYTDIPYLYKMGGSGQSQLAKRMSQKKENLEEISNGINYSIFSEFVRILKEGNLFIWCSKLQIPAILNYFVPIYPNYEILVWNKTNPSPTINNTWLPDIEYCLYFRGKGVQLSGIYDYSSKWFTSAINKKDKDLYDHPTIKPLDLVVRHLQNTTRCGAVILDPFIGSGTTAVAAKMIGAKYIGFEINVKYFRVANDRLNEITQIERRYKNNGCMTIFDFINDDET